MLYRDRPRLLKRLRDRQLESDEETDRQTETAKETDRETDTVKERLARRLLERDWPTETAKETNRDTDRDRQRERLTDKQIFWLNMYPIRSLVLMKPCLSLSSLSASQLRRLRPVVRPWAFSRPWRLNPRPSTHTWASTCTQALRVWTCSVCSTTTHYWRAARAPTTFLYPPWRLTHTSNCWRSWRLWPAVSLNSIDLTFYSTWPLSIFNCIISVCKWPCFGQTRMLNLLLRNFSWASLIYQ